MPIAVRLFRPYVDPTLLGEFGGERGHRQRGRNKEECRGQQPEGDGNGTCMRGGSQPPDADDRGNVEQDQVTQT